MSAQPDTTGLSVTLTVFASHDSRGRKPAEREISNPKSQVTDKHQMRTNPKP